jgi:hypothetical protein
LDEIAKLGHFNGHLSIQAWYSRTQAVKSSSTQPNLSGMSEGILERSSCKSMDLLLGYRIIRDFVVRDQPTNFCGSERVRQWMDSQFLVAGTDFFSTSCHGRGDFDRSIFY